MKIETKYNLGSDIWFMLDNKVQCRSIIYVQAVVSSTSKVELYKVPNSDRWWKVDELYPSKDELLKSL